MKQVKIKKLICIINTILKNRKITMRNIYDNLTILGVDSVSFIQIIVAIEETFNCEIPDSKLLVTEMDSVNKIYNVLQVLYEESKK